MLTAHQDEAVPTVRVVPGGDVSEVYRLGTLLGDGAFSKVIHLLVLVGCKLRSSSDEACRK